MPLVPATTSRRHTRIGERPHIVNDTRVAFAVVCPRERDTCAQCDCRCSTCFNANVDVRAATATYTQTTPSISRILRSLMSSTNSVPKPHLPLSSTSHRSSSYTDRHSKASSSCPSSLSKKLVRFQAPRITRRGVTTILNHTCILY